MTGATILETIKDFTAAAIAERDSTQTGAVAPSDAWRVGAQFFNYVRQLDAEELRFIRRHTFHFTGDIYQRYIFGSASDRADLLEAANSCFARLPGFRLGETEIGIGYDSDLGRISSDLIRYVSVLADLVDSGSLNDVGKKHVLEIGGGYGGLARAVLAYSSDCSYTICDLEETLFCSAVYLSNLIGAERVHLVEGTLKTKDLQEGHVFLIPQSRLDRIEAEFDLALNQQSMQEMNTGQIDRYCDFMRWHVLRFYSRNLPNLAAVTVTSDFLSQFKLVKDLNAYLREKFPRVLWIGPAETNQVGDAYMERLVFACGSTEAPTAADFEALRTEAFRLRSELARATARYDAIVSSRSWRLTRPLRAFPTLFRTR